MVDHWNFSCQYILYEVIKSYDTNYCIVDCRGLKCLETDRDGERQSQGEARGRAKDRDTHREVDPETEKDREKQIERDIDTGTDRVRERQGQRRRECARAQERRAINSISQFLTIRRNTLSPSLRGPSPHFIVPITTYTNTTATLILMTLYINQDKNVGNWTL